MNCQQCGGELREDARFCLSCGAPVAHSQTQDAEPTDPGAIGAPNCTVCGKEQRTTSLFCPECGTRVAPSRQLKRDVVRTDSELKACPVCHRQVRATASFCTNCRDRKSVV